MIALEAGLSLWGAASFSSPVMAAASAPLSAALLSLGLIDVAAFRLPDVLTLPLLATGLALGALAPGDIGARVIGAVGGYGALFLLASVFRRARGREGMGLGDAKLLGAAGAWLGWRALPWTVVLACGVAFAWIGVRWLRRGRGAVGEPVAFGAPLSVAFWLVWLYGAPGV